MRYGKNAVGSGELEHTRRYGELLNTAVGQKDLEDYATSDLGTWYVTVQEENEIDVARSCPALAGFQDIIVAPIVRLYSGSAATLIRPPKDPVRPRDSWRPAVGESASALCYNRGPWGSRHRRTRESPDTDSLLGDFYLA